MKQTHLLLISCMAIVGIQTSLVATNLAPDSFTPLTVRVRHSLGDGGSVSSFGELRMNSAEMYRRAEASPKKYTLAAFFRADNVHFNEIAGNYLTYRNLCQLSSTSKAFAQMVHTHHMPTTPDAWVAYFYETINKLPLKKGLNGAKQESERAILHALMHRLSCSNRPLTHMAAILQNCFSDAGAPEDRLLPQDGLANPRFCELRKKLHLLNQQHVGLNRGRRDGKNNSAELARVENQMHPIADELLISLRQFQPYVLPWLTLRYLTDHEVGHSPLFLHCLPDHPELNGAEVAWLADHNYADVYRSQLQAQHLAMEFLPDIHAGMIGADDEQIEQVESFIIRPSSIVSRPDGWKYNQEVIALFHKHLELQQHQRLLSKDYPEIYEGVSATEHNLKQYIKDQIVQCKREQQKPENVPFKLSILKEIIRLYEEWYVGLGQTGEVVGREPKYFSVASACFKVSKLAQNEDEQRAYIDKAYAYISQCVKDTDSIGATSERQLQMAGIICARYGQLYNDNNMRLQSAFYFEWPLRATFKPSFHDYADAAKARWGVAMALWPQDKLRFAYHCGVAVQHLAQATSMLKDVKAEDLGSMIDYLKEDVPYFAWCIRKAERRSSTPNACNFGHYCQLYMDMLAERIVQIEGPKPTPAQKDTIEPL